MPIAFSTDGMKLIPAAETLWGSLPEGARLTKLRGDASTRSYYRMHVPGGSPETAAS